MNEELNPNTQPGEPAVQETETAQDAHAVLAAREEALARRERRLQAHALLEQHRLPASLAGELDVSSEEAMLRGIRLAQAAISAHGARPAPRAPAPAPDTRAMTYPERAAMFMAQQANTTHI